MISYILLIFSAGLFSCNFLINELYSKKCGNGVQNAFILSLFQAISISISMFIISGGKIEITWFSFLIALLNSFNNLFIVFMALKAFKYANLSVYSMFMMSGSIVFPSAFGVVFHNEKFTIVRVVCFIFIFISLYLNTKKGESNKKAIKYYLAVFAGNGFSGILSKIHQSNIRLRVSTENYLFQSGLISVIISGIIVLILCVKYKKKFISVNGTILGFSGGLVCSLASYFNLFALISIPVSVHSVITTGMTLVFSALFSLILKEKLNKKNIISLFFALGAAVLAIL